MRNMVKTLPICTTQETRTTQFRCYVAYDVNTKGMTEGNSLLQVLSVLW